MQNWENKAKYLYLRKEIWKSRFYLAVGVAVVLGIGNAWTLVSSIINQPVKAARQVYNETEMPEHVWSTVIMFNGSTQCSATIFAKGKEYSAGIGCAHCFTGKIGGKFWVHKPDGSVGVATLLDHDPENDLSLFKIHNADVITYAPFPEEMPEHPQQYDVIGYPKGVGPIYYPIQASGKIAPENNGRWVFDVPDGEIKGGNSGSGVFVDGYVCGVVSHRAGPNDKQLYCAPHNRVKAFLVKNKKKLEDCGGPFCPKDDGQQAPPPPGIPPPADLGNPRPWTPKPNLPYRMPPNLDSDKKQAQAIEEIQKLIIEKLSKIEGGKTEIIGAIKSIPQIDYSKIPKGEEFDYSKIPKPDLSKLDAIHELVKSNPAIEQALKDQAPQVLNVVQQAIQQQAPILKEATGQGLKAVLPSIISAIPGALNIGALPALAAGGPIGLGIAALGFFLRLKKSKTPSLHYDSSPGPSNPSPGPSNSGVVNTSSFVTKNELDQMVQTIIKEVKVPFPVTQQTPPPSQVIDTEVRYVPVETDLHSQAYAWAMSRLSLSNPNQAEALKGQLDSMIQQYISGMRKK